MTLGQTFKFYCYQTESMRNKIAKGFAVLYELSYGEKINVSPRRLTQAYDHIKDFRNICAHEERSPSSMRCPTFNSCCRKMRRRSSQTTYSIFSPVSERTWGKQIFPGS